MPQPGAKVNFATTEGLTGRRLLLQGTGAISQGYKPLDAPIKEHTVSGGGIREQQPIELGDLANDEFFDEVCLALRFTPEPGPLLLADLGRDRIRLRV